MTKTEFAAVMAYLSAGIGKSLAAESCEVYWDLLNDLPLSALQTGAKRVLLEHVWSTFPSPAELRQAATETMNGELAKLSPAQAWKDAWGAIGKIDPDIEGSGKRHLASLNVLVRDTVLALGLPVLVYSDEPVYVIRERFVKAFEQLQRDERRKKLFPHTVQAAIAENGVRPALVERIAGQIGVVK